MAVIDSSHKIPDRLRHPRFSLRTSLVVGVMICLVLAWVREAWRPAWALRELRRMGFAGERDDLLEISVRDSQLTPAQRSRIQALLLELDRHEIWLDLASVSNAGLSGWLRCESITHLFIRSSRLSQRDIEEIGRLPRLESLSIHDSDGPPVPPKQDFASTSLRSLQLENCSMGGQIWYLHGRGTPRLSTFSIRKMAVDEGWCRRLAECRGISQVEMKHVSHGAGIPTEWFVDVNARKLCFDETPVVGKVQDLNRTGSLRDLDLWYVNLTDASLQGISQLSSLKSLGLWGNLALTGAGWHNELRDMQNLRSLNLRFTGVADEVGETLVNCHQIQRIDLEGSDVSVRFQDRIRSARRPMLGDPVIHPYEP